MEKNQFVQQVKKLEENKDKAGLQNLVDTATASYDGESLGIAERTLAKIVTEEVKLEHAKIDLEAINQKIERFKQRAWIFEVFKNAIIKNHPSGDYYEVVGGPVFKDFKELDLTINNMDSREKIEAQAEFFQKHNIKDHGNTTGAVCILKDSNPGGPTVRLLVSPGAGNAFEIQGNKPIEEVQKMVENILNTDKGNLEERIAALTSQKSEHAKVIDLNAGEADSNTDQTQEAA